MLEIVGKRYRLKNGYTFCRCRVYDGYNTQYFYMMCKPDGRFDRKVKSYEQALELSKTLPKKGGE